MLNKHNLIIFQGTRFSISTDNQIDIFNTNLFPPEINKNNIATPFLNCAKNATFSETK